MAHNQIRKPSKSFYKYFVFGDHSFSTYAKFSEKLTFLSPWNTHERSTSHSITHYILMWCIVRLVPFSQFKKREKHQWSSVNFSNFIKCNNPLWLFSIVQMVPNSAKHLISCISHFSLYNLSYQLCP